MQLNVFVTIIALAISLTSLFYVTYSWFTFNRQAETGGPKITIDAGLEYNLKYFIHNLDGGYPKPGHEPVNVVATSYASEFTNVDAGFHDPENYMLIEEPGYRVTFALEITSLPAGTNHEVSFHLNGFSSPAHEEFFEYDNGVVSDIVLAEAINIYTDTKVVTSSDNDTTLTAFVNSHIGNASPTDKFDNTSDKIELAVSPVVSASSSNTTVLMLFTIEFSATSDTFYKFYQIIDIETVYFTRDTTGNSNVYKGLSFVLDEIVVRKDYV